MKTVQFQQKDDILFMNHNDTLSEGARKRGQQVKTMSNIFGSITRQIRS